MGASNPSRRLVKLGHFVVHGGDVRLDRRSCGAPLLLRAPDEIIGVRIGHGHPGFPALPFSERPD
jgi:hypothetical protein